MGCSTCTNNKTEDGVPRGCKSNGSCATGGCSRKTVYNWLNDIEVPTGKSLFDGVEVSFKNGRKNFFINNKNLNLYIGDTVAVEGSPGYDVGIVTMVGELVKHQMNRKNTKPITRDLKKIYRKASEVDLEKWKEARDLEYETMHRARVMAHNLGLNMKLGDVEYQGDKSKAVFYYTAEERVDFRELIKVMADEFRIRIEMKQIGARQEAGRLGGIGVCGRELCCSSWMSDFRSVSTSAARYQQLSLNPQKLAGQCGKLKCCLNFELDQYMEAFKSFPDVRRHLQTKKGNAIHIKTDVFKQKMWFLTEVEKGPNEIIALTIDRVFEIQELNKKGKKPESLKDFMVIEEKVVEPSYENVVGQDDLDRFDQVFKKKKKKNKRRKPSQNTNSQSNKNNNPQNKGNNNTSKNNQQRRNRNKSKNNRNKPNNQNNTSKNNNKSE